MISRHAILHTHTWCTERITPCTGYTTMHTLDVATCCGRMVGVKCAGGVVTPRLHIHQVYSDAHTPVIIHTYIHHSVWEVWVSACTSLFLRTPSNLTNWWWARPTLPIGSIYSHNLTSAGFTGCESCWSEQSWTLCHINILCSQSMAFICSEYITSTGFTITKSY